MFKPTVVVLAALLATPAYAHFGLVLPESSMIAQEDGRSVDVTFAFVHPFEQYGMPLVPPATVSVHADGTTTDLTDSLTPAPLFDEPAFTAEVPLSRPGAYTIAMTPQPYWEPAEDAFIIHYTKTVMGVFGDESGWDTPLGLPVEITPLTRPFGLWQGNVFQGVVRQDGAPVPGAVVEVEHWNTGGTTAPSDLMITQTILADANGVFTSAPPGPGWWGFAALIEADYTLEHEGTAKPVELGGVLWVEVLPWP